MHLQEWIRMRLLSSPSIVALCRAVYTGQGEEPMRNAYPYLTIDSAQGPEQVHFGGAIEQHEVLVGVYTKGVQSGTCAELIRLIRDWLVHRVVGFGGGMRVMDVALSGTSGPTITDGVYAGAVALNVQAESLYRRTQYRGV